MFSTAEGCAVESSPRGCDMSTILLMTVNPWHFQLPRMLHGKGWVEVPLNWTLHSEYPLSDCYWRTSRSYIIGVTSVDIETLNCRARSISVGSSFIVMCCLYLFIFGVAFRNTERYWFICTRCNRGIIASTVQWWFGLRQTASSLTFHPVSLQIFLFLSETFRPLPFVPLTIQQLFFSSFPFNTVAFSLLSLDTFTIYSLPLMAFMLLAFSHLSHLLQFFSLLSLSL